MTHPYHQPTEPEPRPTPPHPVPTPSHEPVPPPKRRKGPLIGGVIAAVLILAGVATTLVVTGIVDFGDEPKIDKPRQKDQTYGYVDDLCGRAQVDDLETAVSPVSGELTEDFADYEDFGVQSCHGQLYNSVTQTFGSIGVDVTIFAEASDAKKLFDPEGSLNSYDLEDFDGDWIDGRIGRAQNPDNNEFGAIILDGNMYLSVTAGIVDFEPDEKKARAAIAETVKRVQEISRKSDALDEPPAKSEETGEVDGEYVFTDDLCEQIDWSVLDAFPFENLDGSEYEPDRSVTGGGVVKCDNGSFDDADLKKNAALLFGVETKKDAAAASEYYQESLNSLDQASESVRDVEGDWQEGKLGEGGTDITVEGSVVILDDNVVVKIALNYWNDDEGSQSDAKKALLELAEQALEHSRG